MTREQFIEKWYPIIQNDRATYVADEFTSDLNSLFNLRTEEEVRDKMIALLKWSKEAEWKNGTKQMFKNNDWDSYIKEFQNSNGF